MNQLSPAELLELISLREASIDWQFQLWLTVTFATIVASFSARHALTTRMRWIVSALYLLATMVAVSRLIHDGMLNFDYIDALAEIGIEYVRSSTPVVVISRLVLIVFGTGATLYFVHVEPRSNGS